MNIKEQNKRTFLAKDRPYQGLFSFGEEDKEYFFGRNREIEHLSELISDHVLTIVFGKSGVGKTSLLLAGLIPRIKKTDCYFPIYLRIDFNNREHPPLEQVKEKIEREIKRVDPGAPAIAEQTLWEYFAYTKVLNGIANPILVFDQFEEIFHSDVRNRPAVDLFVAEIADLVENQVPVTVQERLKKENRYLQTVPKMELRIIFSLREDYLSQLETLRTSMPSVLLSRFQLLQMKGEAAIEAVEKPAQAIIKDHMVAVEIIKKIPGADAGDYSYTPFENDDIHSGETWKNKKIEPFLLSLFCFQANEKRLKKRDELLTVELIEAMDTGDIIADFYEENIADFKAHVQPALENFLLKPGGNRKLQERSTFKMNGGVTDKEIETLVKRRIIRKEIRGGTDYVELIHDVLARILKAKRDKRIEEEKAKEEAIKKRKRTRLILTTLITILIVALTTSLMITFKQEANFSDRLRQKAETGQEAVKIRSDSIEWAYYSLMKQRENPHLSLNLALIAYKAELQFQEKMPDAPKKNPLVSRALLTAFYVKEGRFYEKCYANLVENTAETKSDDRFFFSAFSPDGKKIVTVDSQKAVIWNWKDRDGTGPALMEKERELKIAETGAPEFRPNAAFSPDGSFIAFRTREDETVALWDLRDNENKPVIKIIEKEKNILRYTLSIESNENGLNVFALDSNNTIFLYKITGQDLDNNDNSDSAKRLSVTRSFDNPRSIDDRPNRILRVTLSRFGNLLLSVDSKLLYLRYLKEKKEGIPFKADPGEFTTAAISWDEKTVIAGGDGATVSFNLQMPQTPTIHETITGVRWICFSPDGRFILMATEGSNNSIHLLTSDNFPLLEFAAVDRMNGISFSPDSRYILMSPKKGPVKIYPVNPDVIIRRIETSGLKIPGLTETERSKYKLPPKQ